MSTAGVSVIIPTYNRAALLPRAVKSVLQQTDPALEIIVVDDGSDPEQRASLKQIAGLSANISLHHLPANRGVSYARNYGLRVARGDYLLFLDDDDEIHPHMLAAALASFTADTDVVTFRCRLISEQQPEHGDRTIYYLLSDKEFHKRSVRHWLNRLHHGQQCRELETSPFSAILKSCPATNSSVIRRAAIAGCEFPEDLAFGEDWYFWLSIAHKGCRFKVNDNVYAYVHRHQVNTTRSAETFSLQITRCLNRIMESGMLHTREDRFNLQARYLRACSKNRSLVTRPHLFSILKAPDLIVKFLFFYFCEYL